MNRFATNPITSATVPVQHPASRRESAPPTQGICAVAIELILKKRPCSIKDPRRRPARNRGVDYALGSIGAKPASPLRSQCTPGHMLPNHTLIQKFGHKASLKGEKCPAGGVNPQESGEVAPIAGKHIVTKLLRFKPPLLLPPGLCRCCAESGRRRDSLGI